ncbi:MAG: AMP-binding protein, partial [Maritimibacter sp.]|nr:AMP-binding protein [Maritimibacter sp.]
ATWREAGTVLFSTGDRGAFAEMQARGVNLLIASPAALTPLVRDARATERPRLAGPAIVAGGRLTVELRDQIRAHLCDGARIAYGSSEAGGVTLGDAAALDIHPGQVGAAFSDLAVEVVGPDGTALPPGREGQLRLRTESTVTGYLNDPEASQAHFADGWFYPGDLAMLSAEGALTLLGRTTQVLNLGGVKLPVEALEARLLALEGVEEVCAYLPVAGRSDGQAETPELVIVAVVAEDRAEGLGAAIRTAVPGLPPVALFAARALPRGSMGKVAKPALAEAVTAARAGAGSDDGLGLVSLGVV